MYIVIPTRNRYFTQTTFESIPPILRDKVIFFMLEEEVEAFLAFNEIGNARIITLKGTTCISEVREAIQKSMGSQLYWVLDDDLTFDKRQRIDGKWHYITNVTKYEIVYEMYKEIMFSLQNEDITFGGVVLSYVVPGNSDVQYNVRVISNTFYNGAKLPKDLQWNRCKAAEDIDTSLQLLTQGHRCKVFFKYLVRDSKTNASGGCGDYRTLEMHNESQLKLKELWPQFVRVRETVATNKAWKGQIRLGVVVQFGKAYKSSHLNQGGNL